MKQKTGNYESMKTVLAVLCGKETVEALHEEIPDGVWEINDTGAIVIGTDGAGFAFRLGESLLAE